MAVTSGDLYNQNFATNQNQLQPTAQTIASTTTIAITSLITFITGTVAVKTITPPLTGQTMICLVWTDATPQTTLTTGNLSNAIVPTQNCPTVLFYDQVSAKWWGSTGNLT